jgi:hypothetical protein
LAAREAVISNHTFSAHGVLISLVELDGRLKAETESSPLAFPVPHASFTTITREKAKELFSVTG